MLFDLPGMLGEIMSFCAHQFMGASQANAVEMLVEEVVERWLLPAYRQEDVRPDIDINVSGGEGGVGVAASFVWRGLPEDPLLARPDDDDTERAISRKLVSGVAKRIVARPGVAEFAIK